MLDHSTMIVVILPINMIIFIDLIPICSNNVHAAHQISNVKQFSYKITHVFLLYISLWKMIYSEYDTVQSIGVICVW